MRTHLNMEKIFIRAKKTNSLFIDIEDDGPGIPDKFKKSVQTILQNWWLKKLKSCGGLGLSIANELIKKLKGKIYLKDSKKKGAIFTISL